MKPSQKILLRCNQEQIDAQREFIDSIEPLINDVIVKFNALGLGEVNMQELNLLWKGKAQDIIASRCQDKFKDTEINGIKMKPSKMMEMMDIDFTPFTEAFDKAQSLMREHTQMQAGRSLALNFSINFFILEDGVIKVNEPFFTEWCDKNCHTHTQTETQVEVYKQVKKIADAVNALKEIEIKGEVSIRVSDHNISVHSLKHSPVKLIQNTALGELLAWNGRSYDVNYKFIIGH